MPSSHLELQLPRFSFGIGDRFGHQAAAQLRACQLAFNAGIELAPVWNKSTRAHSIIGSGPEQPRQAADAAIRQLDWTHAYFLDADHINLSTVDRYLESCDFFTLDVADAIGRPAERTVIEDWTARHQELLTRLEIAGLPEPLHMSRERVEQIARHYLTAIQTAGNIYRHIEQHKGRGRFVTEVSMDETDTAQSPEELLVILAGLAGEGIPLQTLAPKFHGRFNKGVDYEGDLNFFAREFAADLAVITWASEHYGLPRQLKLSIHSGSDKFSLYPVMRTAIQRTGAGLHVKTAGTTWLEEVIGPAESGGEGLRIACEIYAEAHAHRAELCAPYAAVIDIAPARLPAPAEVRGWSGERFVRALRHDPNCSEYNPSLRQLIHVAFKIAARMGRRYLDAMAAAEPLIARNVTENLWVRHIQKIFPPTSLK